MQSKSLFPRAHSSGRSTESTMPLYELVPVADIVPVLGEDVVQAPYSRRARSAGNGGMQPPR